MKSTLFRSLLLPALTVTLASPAEAIVLFDGISDVIFTSGFGSAGAPNNTFMGEAVSLDASAFSASLNSVSSFEVGLVNTSGAAITNRPVRLNMYIFLTYTPSAAAVPVFSSQVGVAGTPTLIFDFANLTLNNNSFLTATLTLGTPLVLAPTSGTTIGLTLNWQVDQGAGFVNVASITTPVHGGAGQPPPTVGANATGVAPNFGYYRNASAETNGNFLGTSARNIGTDSGLFIRINGPDPIPEPTTTVLGAVFGLTLLRRRRPWRRNGLPHSKTGGRGANPGCFFCGTPATPVSRTQACPGFRFRSVPSFVPTAAP